MQNNAKKNGGPFWVRTRDLSLIRNDGIPTSIKSVRNYIDLWQKEQELSEISNLTVYGYRQKIEALLDEHAMPNDFAIKRFLVEKQESGCYSGTIANYVKAFRSFFRYLFTKGLYDFDPGDLSLPKIRYKEKRVPTDEEIARLLGVLDRAEDTIAFLLLVDCGVRIHELVTIKLKNINLDDASIFINGKGDKRRTVYLSEITLNNLREYIKICKGEIG